VGLRALSLLIAEHKEDPAERRALEALAADDPQSLVRQVALRLLTGEERWKEYVAANIRNASLTPAERFSPLAYLVQTDQKQDARKLLDDGVIAELVDVVPALVDQALVPTTSLLALLPAENSTAVIGLLLASVDGAQKPGSRTLLLGALANRVADPRVRSKLEMIAAADPEPSLREQEAGVLKSRGGRGQ
jgi:hypothetical protein